MEFDATFKRPFFFWGRRGVENHAFIHCRLVPKRIRKLVRCASSVLHSVAVTTKSTFRAREDFMFHTEDVEDLSSSNEEDSLGNHFEDKGNAWPFTAVNRDVPNVSYPFHNNSKLTTPAPSEDSSILEDSFTYQGTHALDDNIAPYNPGVLEDFAFLGAVIQPGSNPTVGPVGLEDIPTEVPIIVEESIATETNLLNQQPDLEAILQPPRTPVQHTPATPQCESQSPNPQGSKHQPCTTNSSARLHVRRGRRALSPLNGPGSPLTPKSGRKVRFETTPKVKVYLIETPSGGHATPIKRARAALDTYREMLRQLQEDTNRAEACGIPISGSERPHLQYMYDSILHRSGRIMDCRNGGRPWKVWHKEELRVLKTLLEQIVRRLKLTEAEPTRECYECLRQMPLSAFTAQIGEMCKHQTNACNDCVRVWIKLQVECQIPDNILCPQCDQTLSYYEIKALADPATFGKYDTQLAHQLLNSIKHFHWCPKCGSGQIQSPCHGLSFSCESCGHKECLRHHVKHVPLSCKDFDRAQVLKRQGTAAAQKEPKDGDEERKCKAWLEQQVKRCPNPICGILIHKGIGSEDVLCKKCLLRFHWSEALAYDKGAQETLSAVPVSGMEIRMGKQRSRLVQDKDGFWGLVHLDGAAVEGFGGNRKDSGVGLPDSGE